MTREACSNWLYFCNLDSEEFHMMAFSCLPSIAALKVDRETKLTVKFDRPELLEFLCVHSGPMNAMCERAGMFEQRIYKWTKAIFDYFGPPFEAPPPG